MLLSVIIPAYNEEKMIRKAATVISDLLENESILYELIFIDDGSDDATWEEIGKVSADMKNVRAFSFSRNFGKEA
ncbi:MAG: glycosyltransferase, partial [Eubacterium sp.]|nr:glycosyltransferase [Eubacterium sp.]